MRNLGFGEVDDHALDWVLNSGLPCCKAVLFPFVPHKLKRVTLVETEGEWFWRHQVWSPGHHCRLCP